MAGDGVRLVWVCGREGAQGFVLTSRKSLVDDGVFPPLRSQEHWFFLSELADNECMGRIG